MDTSWEMWLKLVLSPVGSPALRKRQGSLNLGKMEKKREREREKKEKKGKGGKEKWKEKKKFWVDGIICLRMAGSEKMVEPRKQQECVCKWVIVKASKSLF